MTKPSRCFRGKEPSDRPAEDDRATEERYLRGLDACEELLVRLDEGVRG